MSLTSDAPLAASTTPTLAAIRTAAEAATERVTERAIQLCKVASPTGMEAARAELVAKLFTAMGGLDVQVDHLSDVVARVPGADSGAAVLIAGHIDTVFPIETSLAIRRSGNRIYGPGIGDNCLGTSAVMAIPEILRALNVIPPVDLLLTGNVGEEGLGDLRGMRRVMDDYTTIGGAIAVEGHNLGRVTHVAVGSHRLRVTVTGPGGHSWGDFGNPNAIQAAAEIIHELSKIALPQSPKTTLSVGTIRGGISVNTIAPEASFDLDLRSVEAFALRRLVDRTMRVLAVNRTGVRVDAQIIGDRPAGFVPTDSRIVRQAVSILEQLGVQPAGDASSTDANVPISRGIPAVCIGLTTGGNVHREDEYIDVGPLAAGLAQLVALTLAIAGDLARERATSS